MLFEVNKMINEEKISTEVQDSIYKSTDYHGIIEQQMNNTTGLLQYKLTVAYRFIKFFKYYKQNIISQFDFECSLRNYLLVFHTKIVIPDYQISSNNAFGLFQSGDTIYANLDAPNYIESKFLQTVFMSDEEPKKTIKKYQFVCNPYIQRLTGYKYFKTIEQQIAVQGALKVPPGYTLLVSMPTGGGKSLITQTVSYQCNNGLTIIIVPTISLMLDQVKNAKKIINSDVEKEIFYYYSDCGISISTITHAIKNHDARMLFLSPETLMKNKQIINAVNNANDEHYLKNIVIDEAHIIVEWGSSFRIDFQCLDVYRKNLMVNNPDLRTYLLSATFSDDTVKQLKLFYSNNDKWIELRLDSLRKEPRFNIIKASSYMDKQNKLLELICKLPHPMIVYVKSPTDADALKQTLINYGFNNVYTFTGMTESKKREKLIENWANNEFDIIIATCAFGVGVDKRDVRTVLHLYVPENPNKYYQECGRGGRDGLPCLGILLYSDDDLKSARGMKQKVLTTEKIIGRWLSMFSSYKTIRNIDGTIIDTSVKPNYHDDDDFFIETTNANINWNIYVLLLLRRNSIINIDYVDYRDDIYYFTVTINDNRICSQNSDIFHIFNTIREKEAEKIDKEFKLISNALKNSIAKKSCWSEMFNDIYTKTDEYCSGCNSHSNIIDGGSIGLHINKLSSPISTVKTKIFNLMKRKNEMIVMYENDITTIINKIIDFGINIIVFPDDFNQNFNFDKNCKETSVMLISLSEFFELCSCNNRFFISGSVIVLINNDKQFSKFYDTVINKNLYCIYLIKEDMYVDSRGKKISEIINGTCVDSNIILKEMDDNA